jgi:hypothetical protein
MTMLAAELREDPIGDRSTKNIVLLAFQLLPRLFISTIPLYASDFIAFADITTLKFEKSLHQIPMFMIYLLIRVALDIRQFDWNESVVRAIHASYLANADLGPEFCLLLILVREKISVQNAAARASDAVILDLLCELFRAKRRVIIVQDYFLFLSRIQDQLFRWNHTAILILGHVTQCNQSDNVADFLRPAAAVFPSQVKKAWTEFNSRLDMIKSINSDGCNLSVRLPDELGVMPFPLLANVPDQVQSYINLLLEFCGILHPSVWGLFFTGLFEALCTGDLVESCHTDIAFLSFVSQLKKPAPFPNFLKGVYGLRLFNPSDTIYTNEGITLTVNELRAIALELGISQSSAVILALVERLADQSPLLLAETIGRLLFRSEFTQNHLPTPSVYQCISMAVGRVCAPAKVPFFRFYAELLGHQATLASVLTSDSFIESFFYIVTTENISTLMFPVLIVAVTSDKSDCDLQVLAESLFKHVVQKGLLVSEISDLVVEIILHRPAAIAPFVRFVDLFVNNIDGSPEGLRRALILIGHLSSLQEDYQLSPKYFRLLAEHVRESDYYTLLSLVAGGFAIEEESFFLFRRPSFLPLVLVATGRNPAAVDTFIAMALETLAVSDFNLRMLHIGDVDKILLTALVSGPRISYLGFQFDLSADRDQALRLLTTIAGIVSDR